MIWPLLLAMSAIGCVLLVRWPAHGVRELIAATLAVTPIVALVGIYLVS